MTVVPLDMFLESANGSDPAFWMAVWIISFYTIVGGLFAWWYMPRYEPDWTKGLCENRNWWLIMWTLVSAPALALCMACYRACCKLRGRDPI